MKENQEDTADKGRRRFPNRRGGVDRRVGERRTKSVPVDQDARRGAERRSGQDRRSGRDRRSW